MYFVINLNAELPFEISPLSNPWRTALLSCHPVFFEIDVLAELAIHLAAGGTIGSSSAAYIRTRCPQQRFRFFPERLWRQRFLPPERCRRIGLVLY